MVPKYNEWLQDPYIQEMTCTEETTLESEYENQESYLKDPSKVIFIIIDLTNHTQKLECIDSILSKHGL